MTNKNPAFNSGVLILEWQRSAVFYSINVYYLTMEIRSKITTYAAIANPILIALLGLWIQATISNDNIKRDYTKIAIEILQSPTTSQDSKYELREWAVAVLDKNSPVPLSPTLKMKLQSGESQLRGIKLPESLMSRSQDPVLLSEGSNMGDLLEVAIQNAQIINKQKLQIEALQKLIKILNHEPDPDKISQP